MFRDRNPKQGLVLFCDLLVVDLGKVVQYCAGFFLIEESTSFRALVEDDVRDHVLPSGPPVSDYTFPFEFLQAKIAQLCLTLVFAASKLVDSLQARGCRNEFEDGVDHKRQAGLSLNRRCFETFVQA